MSNLEKIAAMFPECITESEDDDGNLRRAIDFDLLRQLLSDELIDGREAYTFNFVGKKRAALEAHKPIRKTLRPLREKSRDFDTTANLYIEGDNLDALKILAESYLGKVKLIYIDPPYNTGNDFIYRDDFTQAEDDFDVEAGNLDIDGNRLRANPSSGGRFHSDWCAMIYSRLLIAKHFLAQDGVIFISIDDHEQANLKKICDEVFGEKNFVAQIIWERAYAPVSLKKHFSPNHDYLLCYAKDFSSLTCNGLPRNENQNKDYKNPDNDPRGVWKASNPSVGPAVAKNIYEVVSPSGRKMLPPKGRSWVYSKEKFQEMLADNRIYFGKDGNSIWAPKIFLSEVKQSVTPMTIWKYTEVGHSQDATKALKEIFGDESVFTYPKPVELIKRCLELYTDEDSIVMDFFSGSATTAHAVMELNAQDGGHRRFIMIQLAEATPENSEAYRAGYRTICDIGQERIRRAGDKLKADNPNLDAGFRVFKVDGSNFIDPPAKWTQEILPLYIDNIKADRTALDLLFGALLDGGKTIDRPLTHELIDGFDVFTYDNNVMACFDANITEEVFHKLAARRPSKIFFRDAAFATSADKINAHEYFSYFAENTTIKIL